MVYDIFNFLAGYVRVKIDGRNVERLLNSGRFYWNVKRCGANSIYANVSLGTYRRLIKDTSVGVTLVYERGLFCILKGFFANRAMTAALLVCVAVGILLSNMVLGIEVEEYHGLSENEVKAYIAEYGVTPFTLKRNIDLDELKSFLVSKDRIAWASVGYDGSVLNVQVIEEINEYDDSPCDIVASRQAIIKKIDV